MNCMQITSCKPCLNLSRNPFPRSSSRLPTTESCISHVPALRRNGGLPKMLWSSTSKQRCGPVCMFGGKGKSGDFSETSPFKAVENFFQRLKGERQVEDLLKEQIQKQEYYGDGGSGDNSGGGGGGGGDGFGESEDEGFAGKLDEMLQVTLATIGFIFVYVYLIQGEELTRLARDYIKYLFGAKSSVRLRQAMAKWAKFKELASAKKTRRKDWLQRAILLTPTWWNSPEKLAHLARMEDTY
ncbi:hypothetical protein QJS10_CPA16g00118 [Acorus calamus]|uniref:Glycine-rich protein n=1 Tax=Acorus calamus TaxID=4465 RepID=A0AAV9CZV0_ACOCL|nr:hypothetical protein QJS10_CPA16g00118 [Acorus calamus]